MPKLIDYPLASFSNSLELAEAVNYMGGKCTYETCAHKMGRQVSGSFKTIIGAAVKYNLVNSGKGNLVITDLFKNIKHSYNQEEKRKYYLEAFLHPSLFQHIYEKFSGKELPIKMLDKVLIREYQVEESNASRVVKYFVEGAKFIEVLDDEGKLRDPNNNQVADPEGYQESSIQSTNKKQDIAELNDEDNYRINKKFGQGQDSYSYNNNEQRRIQIPLPQKRMAELIIPAEITEKDLKIIEMQLEVLKVFIESNKE